MKGKLVEIVGSSKRRLLVLSASLEQPFPEKLKAADFHRVGIQEDLDVWFFAPDPTCTVEDLNEVLEKARPSIILNFGLAFYEELPQIKQAKEKYKMIYLACPYADEDDEVRMGRVNAAIRAAAVLTREGSLVYSPISHSRPITSQVERDGFQKPSHDYWMQHSLAMLANCSKLIVLCEKGWSESKGVTEEIEFAKAHGIRVQYAELYSYPISTATTPGHGRTRTGLKFSNQAADGVFDLGKSSKSAVEQGPSITKGVDGSMTPAFTTNPNQFPVPQNLTNLAAEVHRWQSYNFAPTAGAAAFKGMVEELGELAQEMEGDPRASEPLKKMQAALGRIAHGILKTEQGIRGNEDHQALVEDAVGDLIIYSIDFCNQMKIDFAQAVYSTWAKVRTRDWVRFPENGKDK